MPFDVALTGLNAARARLRTTSNNIANVATPGFKQSRAETVANPDNGGVRVAQVRPQNSFGGLEFSGNGLDMGVAGKGYFRLNDSGETVYSRDGSFNADRDGYITNARGQRLTGVNAGGQFGDLRIPSGSSAPVATSNISISANLDATESAPSAPFNPADASSFNHSMSVTAYDSLGAEHQVDVYFRESGVAGSVEVHAYADGNAVLGPSTISFDSTGKLSSPASGSLSVPAFNPGNGAANMNVSLDVSKLTRYGADYSVNAVMQDGKTASQVTGVAVEQNGNVVAQLSNGDKELVGQVALADFSNTQGLHSLGNNSFGESFSSGSPTLGLPQSGGFGSVMSGQRELSNVNLEEQLVNMKAAEHEFSANAAMIKAEDEMLGTLFDRKA